MAPGVGGGEVDREGPRAVIGLGGEPRAARAELLVPLVAAAAPAVDTPPRGSGAHGDHFQRLRIELTASSVGLRSWITRPPCDHIPQHTASDLRKSLGVATSAAWASRRLYGQVECDSQEIMCQAVQRSRWRDGPQAYRREHAGHANKPIARRTVTLQCPPVPRVLLHDQTCRSCEEVWWSAEGFSYGRWVA